MTRATVVAGAVELTRQHGLLEWTVRDLASHLRSWPAVLYHHVGDREALSWAVVEEVVDHIDPPDPDLPWQHWFREFLYDWPRWTAEYPGVAEFLVLRGPAVASALRILEAGMQTLQRAGFGSDAPAAYSMLLNTAGMYLAIQDRRRAAPTSHQLALVEAMASLPEPGPGVTAMQHFAAGFVDGAEAAGRREAYFRTSIDVVIAGWEQRLATTTDPSRRAPARTSPTRR